MKALSFILFFLTLLCGVVSVLLCLYLGSNICSLEIREISDNLPVVLATFTGAVATCSMFAFQKYDSDKKEEERNKDYSRKEIYTLIDSLLLERNRIIVSYPAIDDYWQEVFPQPKAKGISAFKIMLSFSNALLESINYKVYLTHNNEIASQIKNEIDQEMHDFYNCPDKDEYNYIDEKYYHTKKEMLLGLYNKFSGLNKKVYSINKNREEAVKIELCAYYLLNCYEQDISKYLEILNHIVTNIKNYRDSKFSYTNTSDYIDIVSHLQSLLSQDEWDLICKFLIYKKKNLKWLILS